VSDIVRVYRRSELAGREASGLVERVGNGGRQAFDSGEELWRFIAGVPRSLPRHAGRLPRKMTRSRP
jgi:hypothetical protein